MFGYMMGATAVWWQGKEGQTCGYLSCWRFPFLVQAACLLPICLAAMAVPPAHINVSSTSLVRRASEEWSTRNESTGLRQASDDTRRPNDASAPKPTTSSFSSSSSSSSSSASSASSSSSASLSSPSFDLVERAERNSTGSDVPHVSSSSFVYDRIARPRTNATCGALRQILGILRTPGFTVIVLGLSALFFVVTGVQFWATDFLISVMNGNKYTVMLLFVATSATAPVAGVAFGGWVIDRCAGGFRGANRPKALRLVTLLGVLANFAGWVGGWYDSKSIYFVVGCIWLLLFFGAACLPPLTGMYMDAVPDKRLKVRTGQSEGGGTRERGEGSGE